MGFIFSIIIGILAGFLAGKIWKGTGYGLIVNLIAGVTGGVLGGWAFDNNLIMSTVVALILLRIISLIKRRETSDQ